MSYTAPVKDMLFNMQHLAALEEIAQIPGFEEAGLETAQAVLEGAGGHVFDVYGSPLRYGKADVLNPSFIASAAPFAALPMQG